LLQHLASIIRRSGSVRQVCGCAALFALLLAGSTASARGHGKHHAKSGEADKAHSDAADKAHRDSGDKAPGKTPGKAHSKERGKAREAASDKSSEKAHEKTSETARAKTRDRAKSEERVSTHKGRRKGSHKGKASHAVVDSAEEAAGAQPAHEPLTHASLPLEPAPHENQAHENQPPDVVLPSEGFIADKEPEDGEKYELKMARQSGELIDVIYRVGDAYIPEAIDNLSQFLRDSHNDEVKSYNPRIFDLLHTMLRKVGRSGSEIEVLCGYRTKATNDALRRSRTTNAAKHSQHIEANALDIRVPGVAAVELRDAALSLGAGGVGYYPRGQFIHVDAGDVRMWTFSRRRGGRTHRHRRA